MRIQRVLFAARVFGFLVFSSLLVLVPLEAAPPPGIIVLMVRKEAAIHIDSAFAYTMKSSYYNGAFKCVSFTNTSDKVATHIKFVFVDVNVAQRTRVMTVLERQGTFSPNVPIEVKFDAGSGFRGARENCVGFVMPPEGVPMTLVFVDRVDYADGTSWVSPSAIPEASASPSAAPSASPTPAASPMIK